MSCAWPVDRSCLPTASGELEIERQRHAEETAIAVLWALSGRQFGVCSVIVRPCPEPCYPPNGGSWLGGPGWYPMWDDGRWRNVTCGCSGGGCFPGGPSVIHLPGPVDSITEVKISGVVLDPAAYKLEGNLLYRTGGEKWPSQNLGRPLDEAGTWSVTYGKGIPVPAGVGVLVGLLAKEFISACTGGKCRLPRNVENVTRNGVSYRMVDPTPIYAARKTGLSEIDLWLTAVNPAGLMAPPRVI
jgi:hypothetical protein